MTSNRHPTPPDPRRSGARIDPAVFEFPAEKIRGGFYSDKYFPRTRSVLVARRINSRVTMQVFQRKRALVAGTDEGVGLLRTCLTKGYDFGDLRVRALRDGDRADPLETVMLIEGPYAAFAHLETLYTGILARRSRIATRTREAVEAAWPKRVLYFPARHDHWLNQPGDGWAAMVAGAGDVSTDAQGSWWGGAGTGTVPHGLIAAFGGDTVAAAKAFVETVGEEVNLVTLVDFHNDSVGTSLEVARALGDRLWGVRLDTAGNMVDHAVRDLAGEASVQGVNTHLVARVRDALDAAGFGHVRIVVSGGLDAPKIRAFESEGARVDAYGVGSSLMRGTNDFTADIVEVDGRAMAKAGRWLRPNDRLEVVE